VDAKTRRVLREALQLLPKTRADVAGVLLRSLDGPDEDGLDEAWATEATRRIADVDSGRVKLVSWQRARQGLSAEVPQCRTKR
jgi:hypothetical protein